MRVTVGSTVADASDWVICLHVLDKKTKIRLDEKPRIIHVNPSPEVSGDPRCHHDGGSQPALGSPTLDLKKEVARRRRNRSLGGEGNRATVADR
ncbi:hypothetical protein L484_003635 [Morus notabilis]|uniref:Uncharacterized protein n=1 Tax=Morus notabilis TaxID=981085 RepID=W9RT55_9ROSA|nr:hypothetical protein L484_003635 [Morus notabilis]